MSKKRKTKRQKLISDLRKKLQDTSPSVPVPSPITTPKYFSLQHVTTPHIKPIKTYNTNGRDYTYVKEDIIKTFSISSILIGANILLFILVEKNIINLTFLGL